MTIQFLPTAITLPQGGKNFYLAAVVKLEDSKYTLFAKGEIFYQVPSTALGIAYNVAYQFRQDNFDCLENDQSLDDWEFCE